MDLNSRVDSLLDNAFTVAENRAPGDPDKQLYHLRDYLRQRLIFFAREVLEVAERERALDEKYWASVAGAAGD